MIESYKGRLIDAQKPVMVYRNLSRRCWSIKQDGRVVGHAEDLYIEFQSYKISKAGQARVRREHKKYVHAFIVGKIISKNKVKDLQWYFSIKYNPYIVDSFVLTDPYDDIFINIPEYVWFNSEGRVKACV